MSWWAVAGDWQRRTKRALGEAIQVGHGLGAEDPKPLSKSESLVLLAIAYFQPITRDELG